MRDPIYFGFRLGTHTGGDFIGVKIEREVLARVGQGCDSTAKSLFSGVHNSSANFPRQ